ncbi:MAG: alpha/beta hydrolase [Fibrobacteres bacterium]|nr:alpha/beta hydrolase [Fibrobacterota bacterium]
MECVVLLHGLARTDKSMSVMQARLEREGFLVVNHGYPSRKYPIEELANRFLPLALAQCARSSLPSECGKIHFVTHSLGGILVRQYLNDHRLPKLGRVVMLGPPNHGSQVVDKLAWAPGFSWYNGPAGMQLGTSETGIPARLGPADFEVGVIAGTRSINLFLSLFLPNPNDGKVSVENTKLAGMQDHIQIPVSHPFLMRDPKAIGYTVNFLKTGSFR